MSYKVRPYRKTAVPDAATLHGLQRFTAGYTPALLKQVRTAGGFDKWFNRQLADGYPDDWYSTTSRWWASINSSDAAIWARHKAGSEELWRADANYQRWALVRRVGSQRQVREVMAEFWEHHLHVPAVGEVGPYRTSYGKTIRTHALGRFDQMLVAAITHPAMAVYLDNANSTKAAPNENLGRELLELHTVGRGNYTEDDVKNSARMLTGYRMGKWTDWVHSYDPAAHWTGAITVMGFQHANTAADGRPALTAYLQYLAHHPATAHRIATKLARRFVSDTPDAALVNQLAKVYLANKTAIGPVLKALVASTAFKKSAGAKVRTPTEDVVATWRALDTRFKGTPGPEKSGANQILWQAEAIGQLPFDWKRPDGRPDTAVDWSSTSRFLSSLNVHYTMSGGWAPEAGVTHRTPKSRLPPKVKRIRFDQLVDHLSRTMLGRASTPLLLRVACEATGCRVNEVITVKHRIVRWDSARLLTVFLDSPTHMTR